LKSKAIAIALQAHHRLLRIGAEFEPEYPTRMSIVGPEPLEPLWSSTSTPSAAAAIATATTSASSTETSHLGETRVNLLVGFPQYTDEIASLLGI